MLLIKRHNTVRTVVGNQPPDNGCKPSVDILFRSGASVYSKDIVAISLTGMGVDGIKRSAVLEALIQCRNRYSVPFSLSGKSY